MSECWREEIVQEKDISCHLRSFDRPPSLWHNPELERRWSMISEIRNTVSNLIERMRDEKKIKSSLEAKVLICINDQEIEHSLSNINMEEILITSSVQFTQKKDEKFSKLFIHKNANIYIKVEKFHGEKCQRCWRFFEKSNLIGEICKRCYDAHYKA